MRRIAEDGKTLTHCAQDDGLVVHLHLDKVGGDKVALVLDSDVQVLQGDVCLKPVGTAEKRR